MKPGKNLSFEEAFMDLQNEDADVMDDEREDLNYRAIGSVVLVCLAILLGRVFFLQAIKGPEYKVLAEGNKFRTQYVLAPRGLVLDKFGKVIAGNIPSFELVVVPADLPKDPAEFQARLSNVAQMIGKPEAELREQISKMDPKSYLAQTVAENLTKDQALVLIAKQSELKGFLVQNNAIRDYKDPAVFAHLIGYTGKITTQELDLHKDTDYALNDYIGKSGLEYQYEQTLRGIAGKRQTAIDAQGNFKGTTAEVPAKPGSNIKLNVDYDLQRVVYDSLLNIMSRGRAKKAAAVATNPQTGEALALVSLPSFDNNMFAHGITQAEYSKLIKDPNIPLLNRTIAGTYPPGSTIKPVMATAALSEGIVTPQTKILDDGVIRIGSYTFYGYEREGLGIMDIYSAIARSSDIYFYSVGGGNAKSSVKEGLGPERIAKWFRKFNLGSTLGIDLPAEKQGLVPDPDWKRAAKNESWYLGDTYHESIGQGDVLTTPLQINSWTATIANGGKIMRPFILDEESGGKAQALAENLFDPAVIKIVQDGMRQTVTAGSGSSLKNLGVEISGKTGTAQFDARNLSLTHSLFTSYAPSGNPQIALTVIVESGGEGHSVAVPIAKLVYEWWIENRYNK